MTDSPLPENGRAAIDPDPFSIALAVVGAVAGAGAWLEARRSRVFEATNREGEFRAAWFNCERSVGHLDRVVAEYASHVAEQEFGHVRLRFGAIRIGFTSEEGAKSLERLSRQVDTTKSAITENFNRLSEFLDPRDTESIHVLLYRVMTLLDPLPPDYDSVITTAREAITAMREFLAGVAEMHGLHKTPRWR